MISIQEKAAQLFNNPLVDESLNLYNQQQYIKAMEFLGEKHIISKSNHIERKDN
jgi:hypothetical protein